MGALEEQARFLTAKYGTAAGSAGLPHTGSTSLGAPEVMVFLGLLIFAAILFLLLRDFSQLAKARSARREVYQ